MEASYIGEDSTNQFGVEIRGVNGYDISTDDVTEAFDEPLTMEPLLAIVSLFI